MDKYAFSILDQTEKEKEKEPSKLLFWLEIRDNTVRLLVWEEETGLGQIVARVNAEHGEITIIPNEFIKPRAFTRTGGKND